MKRSHTTGTGDRPDAMTARPSGPVDVELAVDAPSAGPGRGVSIESRAIDAGTRELLDCLADEVGAARCALEPLRHHPEQRVCARARDALSRISLAGGLVAAARRVADSPSDDRFATASTLRVVDHRGGETFVPDGADTRLLTGDRTLGIDGVREVIVRDGVETANLRRRRSLKRMLYLFAAFPTRPLSNETLVDLVWDVDYHPLRHDPALHTNIMRVRRLLGRDGLDLVRATEGGYRFVPPAGYLYVHEVTRAPAGRGGHGGRRSASHPKAI